MLILDRDMLSHMNRMAPETGVYDLSQSRTISNNILIPAPMVATMDAYIRDGDREFL